MITAKLALEQGREVFSVPGSIFSPYSRGTHLLIREGAKLVEETADIIEEIQPLRERWHPTATGEKEREKLSPDEKEIYNIFPFEPVSIDFLLEHSGLGLGKISQLLISLEMKGLVKPFAGHTYQRLGVNQISAV